MTDPIAGDDAGQHTRPTVSSRAAERTADPMRGTDGEHSDERAARERRSQRRAPMPADRHE